MKIIKVLVDEMPSGCKRCNFCVAKMYCSLLEDRKTTVPDEPHKRRADCPLVYDFGDRETNALNKRIAELEAERRWIPVGERLPEPYTRVLACIKSGYMEVDYMYSEPIVDVGIADFNSLDNVTHWMPLPPSPESEVE